MSIQLKAAPEGPTGEIGEIPNGYDTDYTLGQDNIHPKVGPFSLDIHNPVFFVSSLTIIVFVAVALAAPTKAEAFFGWLRPALTSTFDWFFLSAANVFVIVALALIVSPLGRIRIGGKDAKPDYSYAGWFSMLFAAGMGIGLMFFGVAEPISHFSASVAANRRIGGKLRTAGRRCGKQRRVPRSGHGRNDLSLGTAPVGGLRYRRSLPCDLCLQQGAAADDPVDLLSDPGRAHLGLAGPHHRHPRRLRDHLRTRHLTRHRRRAGQRRPQVSVRRTCERYIQGLPDHWHHGNGADLSVVAGLDAGIKRLSAINMGLAALLLAFIVLAGPTLVIATGFFHNLVAYAEYLPALANPFGREDTGFSQGWTAFYWAWWISWSPFVGMFIARVSRGRSVREFLICVLLIPSAVSVLWMTAFGGTAIDMVNAGYQALVDAPLELKLFSMLANLPLAAITSFLGIVLVIVFFVTSSDSGSLVVDTITAGGKVDRTGFAAGVLVQLRGAGRHRAAPRRRPEQPAGGGGVDRSAVRRRSAGRLLRVDQGPALGTTRQLRTAVNPDRATAGWRRKRLGRCFPANRAGKFQGRPALVGEHSTKRADYSSWLCSIDP